MSEADGRLWRAGLSERATEEQGMGIFAWYGFPSPCGRYVSNQANPTYRGQIPELVHWERNDSWHDTQAAARASMAETIRRIARRMLAQADELEAERDREIQAGPAVATAVQSSAASAAQLPVASNGSSQGPASNG